jgi:hypothetical protein
LRRAALVFGGALTAALLAARPARAEGNDGLYGRFEGDLELRTHAGVAFASGGPALAASVTLLYLSTVGIYVDYTDALGSESPRVARSLAVGVHFAPLFLARGARNWETGGPYFDLLVDSLAFELGTFWAAPSRSTWDEQPGLEVALGMALPILPRSSGPFLGLRGALRWRATDFVAGTPGSALERGAVLSVTFGWHQVLRTHLVDAGDGSLP